MYYIVGIMDFGMTKGSEGGAISERGLLRVGDVVRSSLELGDPNSGFSLAPNAYSSTISYETLHSVPRGGQNTKFQLSKMSNIEVANEIMSLF